MAKCIKFTYATIVLILYVLATFSFSQEVSYCDPSLTIRDNMSNGYKMRGNRCEGIYVEQVANSTSSVISINSFTDTFEGYDLLQVDEPLVLSWRLPADMSGVIKVESESNVRKLYYRMDTQVLPTEAQFEWPIGMLSVFELPKEKIGIVGLSSIVFSSQPQDVYFPPSIKQGDRLEPSGSYSIQVTPTEKLAELSYYMASSVDGYPEEEIIVETPLGYRYYPQDTPINFELDLEQLAGEPVAAGYYYLELIAETEKGTLSTLPIWFYHAGK
jgi:hypothetical protein